MNKIMRKKWRAAKYDLRSCINHPGAGEILAGSITIAELFERLASEAGDPRFFEVKPNKPRDLGSDLY